MPSVLIATAVVLALASTVAVTLLWLRLRKTERSEAAAEKRIKELLDARSGGTAKAVNETGRRERPSYIWPVPVLAALAGAVKWISAHKAPTVTVAAGTVAATALVMTGTQAGPASPELQAPDPPVAVGPLPTVDAPSWTTPLPPASTTVTVSPRPEGRRGPKTVEPTATTATVPALPTITTSMPTVTTSMLPTLPPETPAADCLLKVKLTPLVDACVGGDRLLN